MATETKRPNRAFFVKQILLEIIVFLCVLLFVYTSLSKLIATSKFFGQISSAPLIGPYSAVIVWAVPVAELLVAVLIVIPRFRVQGLFAFSAMMVTFTAYIVYIILFAPHIPCSCGGVLEAMGWGDHLVFNALFLALGIAGFVVVLENKRSFKSSADKYYNIFSGKSRGRLKTCRKE